MDNDAKKLAKSSISIAVAPNDIMKRSVMKWFEVTGGVSTVLVGDEFDDHEIWCIDEKKAFLVGTLSEDKFKELSHCRKGSILDLKCSPPSFAWLNKGWPGQSLVGKGVSAYDLGNRVTGPAFTLAEKD